MARVHNPLNEAFAQARTALLAPLMAQSSDADPTRCFTPDEIADRVNAMSPRPVMVAGRVEGRRGDVQEGLSVSVPFG